MRILLFTTAYKPMVGGSEIAIEHIAQRLPGVFFDIVTPRYNKAWPQVEQKDNVSIQRIGFGSRIDKWLFPFWGAAAGLWLVRRNQYKAIHGYQASHASGAAWIIKQLKPSLKFILTLQEGKPLEQQPWLVRFFRGLLIKRADHITAISNYLGDYAKQFGKTASLIPNGVAIEHFRPGAALDNSKKRIITVSRLVPKNGLANLIQASALLALSHNIELTIAGDGYLRKELEALSRSLGIADQVIFTGTVEHSDLPKLLQGSHAFVRPSASEGLGSAFLEAMACGVPIIGPRVGGIPDFLEHGQTGLFCDPQDPKDIAEKIKLVFNDNLLRDRMVSNGLARVKEQYTWQKVAEKMDQIYQTI